MREQRHPSEATLAAYLDGHLPPRRALRVDRHLAGCARCAEDLDLLRAVTFAVRSLEEIEPPSDWLRSAFERVARGERPRASGTRGRRRVRVAAAVAGTGAAALGVGLWLAPPPQAPESFQDQIRQHLVQVDNPLADQPSYVVESRDP